MGFVSFQTIFHPCSDYYQIAQNDDDDGKSVEAEVEQGHDPAPGRDQGESSRPHGIMAQWHHGTMAPWHYGTAMLPLPRHCHGNNMELRMLASWHHGTIRLSHRTTAQQELEVRMRKPTKHLPGLQPKAGKWGFSGPQSKQFTWSSCLLDNC